MSFTCIFCNICLFFVLNLGFLKNQTHARQLIFHSIPKYPSDQASNKVEEESIALPFYSSLESLNVPDVISPLQGNEKQVNFYPNTSTSEAPARNKTNRLKSNKNKRKKKSLKKGRLIKSHKKKASGRKKLKSKRWKHIKDSRSKENSKKRQPVDIIVHIKMKD